MRHWLFHLEEPDAEPRELPVEEGATIGRHPSCEIPLEDPHATVRHARVVTVEGELLIEDLGSTNGTRIVGGRKLGKGERTALHPGLAFLVGQTRIEVREPFRSGMAPTLELGDDMKSTLVLDECADARTSSPPPGGARLIVAAPIPAHVVELDEKEFIVGRSRRRKADILLEHEGVSGLHARLVLTEGAWWVEDLGSTNGTFVDDARAPANERTRLTKTCRVRFGPVDCVFTDGSDPTRDAAALDALERAGRLREHERRAAEGTAKKAGVSVGEWLVLQGALLPDEWVAAVHG